MKKKKILLYILIGVCLITIICFITQIVLKDKEQAFSYYLLKMDTSTFSQNDMVDIYVETSNEYGKLAGKIKISNITKSDQGFNVVLELPNDIFEIMNKMEYISDININLVKYKENYKLNSKKKISYDEILDIINTKIETSN